MHKHEKQSNMLAAAEDLLLYSERDGWYFLSIYAGKEAEKRWLFWSRCVSLRFPWQHHLKVRGEAAKLMIRLSAGDSDLSAQTRTLLQA